VQLGTRNVWKGKTQVLQARCVAGGRFRLIEPVGKGGMGTVWWARHEVLGRDVALKLSSLSGNKELHARFLREAQIVARFQHPNIVAVLDAGELDDEGSSFLAMELLRGQTFAGRFLPGQPVAADEVLPILIGVCRGLEIAHAEGVIHRDIKPENIFLTDVPGQGIVPKILDFGISKTIDASITVAGQLLGTPAYMSPEQAMGDIDVTPATDIWAVGVMLYEALAGRQPFAGKDYRALLRRIVDAPHPPIPAWIDSSTTAIIERCLQKDPAVRYANAAELRLDLERALERRQGRRSQATIGGGETQSWVPIVHATRRSSLPPPAPRRSPLRTLAPLFVAAACLGFGGAAFVAAPSVSAESARLEPAIGRIAMQRSAQVPMSAPAETASEASLVHMNNGAVAGARAEATNTGSPARPRGTSKLAARP
jgi:eukaryotic-like serine/threonine-protein kinase